LYGWVRSIRLQTTDTVPNVSEGTKCKGECLLNIAHIVVLSRKFQRLFNRRVAMRLQLGADVGWPTE
jgi:hypothetical protein